MPSNPHDEKPLRLSTEEPLQLGPPPRSCYPLVVILARDLRDTGELRPDDTVALISVVHIRDEQCPLPSGVIAQYLKQANGHLSCLKQLYVSGECGAAAEYGGGGVGGVGGVGGAPGDALCCVCAAAPLSRALLPCRHACLCQHCLPKLDKCPICRSVITSYFCIRNDDERDLSELKQQRFFNRRLFNLFHYH
ncbi:cell growth regulator with RING finger domain protein 1-like [Trichoplusia ni]|uniref:Cell growth regulator with RING finger domain protein 1-like n=1 Tax=Trichoplusia ni TaxID=7111 RepID=A0A7E5WYL2_TRINI|nr:cell growth regulator with RING finger domain protein 1-like [Trichoplusia ni]